MKAAQSALLKHAHRIKDAQAHLDHHERIVREIEEEIELLWDQRETFIDAAWATLTTEAERDALAARVEAIEEDYFLEVGADPEEAAQQAAEDALNEYNAPLGV